MDNLFKLATESSRYCIGMEGNISAKTTDGLWIKASGARLNSMTQDDFVKFDFDGKQLSNKSKKGSMELSFHTYLLGFHDINYVSHTHPTNTLKILCSEMAWVFAHTRLFPDQIVFNGKKSCLVPYAKPGQELTDEIKFRVDEYIKAEGCLPKLILLQNHGIITCGKTVDECVIANDICEKSAEIFLGSQSLKQTRLTTEQINELITDKNEIYRQGLLK